MVNLLINTNQLDNEEDPLLDGRHDQSRANYKAINKFGVKIGKKNTRKVNNRKLLIAY